MKRGLFILMLLAAIVLLLLVPFAGYSQQVLPSQKGFMYAGGGSSVTPSHAGDTIAVNFHGNSTSAVADSASSHWNNMAVSGSPAIYTRAGLKWKSDYTSIPAMTVTKWHSGFSQNTTVCSGTAAQNMVIQWASTANGSTTTGTAGGVTFQVGDPTLGGVNIYLTGIPAGTYDFQLVAGETVGAYTQTIYANGSAATASSGSVYQTCFPGGPKITGIDCTSGNLTITVKGSTATAVTYINGFLLIKH
jgi:hypothetical protein